MLKAKTFVKEVDRNSGLGRIYSYRYGKKKKVSRPSSSGMNDSFFKESSTTAKAPVLKSLSLDKTL